MCKSGLILVWNIQSFLDCLILANYLVELTRFCHFDRGGLLLPTVVLSLDLENSTPVVNCEFFAFSARALYAMMMF